MTVLVSTLLQILVATHLAEKSFFPSCVCPPEHATSRHPSRCLTAHDAAAFMLARRNIITAHPHAPAFSLEHARQAITRTFRSKTLASPRVHIQAFLSYVHHALMPTSPSRAHMPLCPHMHAHAIIHLGHEPILEKNRSILDPCCMPPDCPHTCPGP